MARGTRMMLVDDDGELLNVDNAGDVRAEQQIALQRSQDAQYVHNGSVSTLHRCETIDAKKLCIYDLDCKIKITNEYDIGGTYTGEEPDLWFYFTTSVCPGNNYLLNLFVCHRKIGNFSIGVSNSNEYKVRDRPADISGWTILPRTLTWYTFKSAAPNENYHIKTFCFAEKDVTYFHNNIVFIPISIVLNASHSLNSDIIKSIKLKHDHSSVLNKQEHTDFVLESATTNKFPTHRIILAAHSPVLRSLIKDSKVTSMSLDISDSDMTILLEFLYSGTINDILNQDCDTLLKLADKFQLSNLFLIAELVTAEHINVENAVDIALLAQRYKLQNLRHKVLSFIKNNPKVMQTDGWAKLKDVNLIKQLVEHIYSGSVE
ncbi:unnamed protein product [Chilo suppressalis]|uniref:BTB domain-containing protein n=1 Tax=Chilo suppressalis TaxID=168631 RepID=A0ABN8B828_CHISP|nr:unnamed protein product [Chilo suppressalis]